MIALGVILLVVGLVVPVLHILFVIGLIVLVIGLVLAAMAASGRGRWYY